MFYVPFQLTLKKSVWSHVVKKNRIGRQWEGLIIFWTMKLRIWRIKWFLIESGFKIMMSFRVPSLCALMITDNRRPCHLNRFLKFLRWEIEILFWGVFEFLYFFGLYYGLNLTNGNLISSFGLIVDLTWACSEEEFLVTIVSNGCYSLELIG